MDYTYLLVAVVSVFLIGLIYLMVKNILSSIKGDKARKLLEAGEYKVLINRLSKDIEKSPRYNKGHYYLAEAYFKTGEPEDAIKHYNKVILIGKYDSEIKEDKVRDRLAESYITLGDYKEAQKEFLLILKKLPNDYEYNYRFAELLYESNYRNGAKKYYLNVLKLNPKHKESLFRLGEISYETKSPNECLLYMHMCIELDSSSPGCYYYMGRVYLDTKNYVKALEYLQQAIKSKEYKLQSYYYMGLCYYNLMDFDSALVELDRGLSYIESDEVVGLALRYLMANIYEQKRNLPMAVSQWEAISLIRSDYKDVASKLAEYEDIRLDDELKDFLVAPEEKFVRMCKDVVRALELEILECSNEGGTIVTIYATESSGKWSSQRRNKLVVRIYRTNNDITRQDVRRLLDDMKSNASYRSILISSSTIGRNAYEYGDTRPIYLYDKYKLSGLLKKAYAN